MRFRFRKRKVYTMDVNIASKTLQNVLTTCNREPSNIPLDELLMRQKPQTRFYTVMKYLTLVLLLLTFLSPFAFKHPPVRFQTTATGSGEFILDSHYVMNGNLYLEVRGETIDVSDCYMLTDSGARFTPSSFNKKKGQISFPYDGEGANIYIESVNGSSIQIIMTLRNN